MADVTSTPIHLALVQAQRKRYPERVGGGRGKIFREIRDVVVCDGLDGALKNMRASDNFAEKAGNLG